MRLTLSLLALLLAVVPAAAADISGAWQITGDVMGNAVNPECNFKVGDDNKVTGDCKGDGDASPITGTLADKKLTFTWETQGYTLTFTGTLDSDTEMKGSIEVAGADGTFTAKKK